MANESGRAPDNASAAPSFPAHTVQALKQTSYLDILAHSDVGRAVEAVVICADDRLANEEGAKSVRNSAPTVGDLLRSIGWRATAKSIRAVFIARHNPAWGTSMNLRDRYEWDSRTAKKVSQLVQRLLEECSQDLIEVRLPEVADWHLLEDELFLAALCLASVICNEHHDESGRYLRVPLAVVDRALGVAGQAKRWLRAAGLRCSSTPYQRTDKSRKLWPSGKVSIHTGKRRLNDALYQPLSVSLWEMDSVPLALMSYVKVGAAKLGICPRPRRSATAGSSKAFDLAAHQAAQLVEAKKLVTSRSAEQLRACLDAWYRAGGELPMDIDELLAVALASSAPASGEQT